MQHYRRGDPETGIAIIIGLVIIAIVAVLVAMFLAGAGVLR